MRIQTKHGVVSVQEDELGAVSITFNSDEPVVVEMRASNAITSHTVDCQNNTVRTMKTLKKINLEEY